MTLEFTDVAELLPGIDVKNLPTIVPLSTLIDLHKALSLREMERDTARKEAEALAQEKAVLTQETQTLTGKLSTANQTSAALEKQVQDLTKALAEATKPPVVVPPPPPIPAPNARQDVWPEEPAFLFDRRVMATIENSMTEPSPTQYTAVKRGVDTLEALGVDAIRLYLGPLEVLGHLDPTAKPFGSLGNLADYIRAKKRHVIADGIDRVLDLLTDAQLAVHVAGLETLRFAGVCWNDADKDDVSKLADDVARIRTAGWNGPIIFSLRGSAKIADYAEIKDIVFEFQTFGKPGEFPGFVATDADILCLDLRVPQTRDDIAHLFSVALAHKTTAPRGYTLYTSKTRDWVATPADEVTEIRRFTQRLKAAS